MTFLGKMSNYIKIKYIILFLGDNNMKDKKFIIVKCPKCGYEYLPAEIFTRAFLGKPDNPLYFLKFLNSSILPVRIVWT